MLHCAQNMMLMMLLQGPVVFGFCPAVVRPGFGTNIGPYVALLLHTNMCCGPCDAQHTAGSCVSHLPFVLACCNCAGLRWCPAGAKIAHVHWNVDGKVFQTWLRVNTSLCVGLHMMLMMLLQLHVIFVVFVAAAVWA